MTPSPSHPLPSPPIKTTPTERLTSVLVEALEVSSAHKTLQNDLTLLLKSWGQMPPEDTLAALRDALDHSLIHLPLAIPHAVAYLRANGLKIAAARRDARVRRGASSIPDYNPSHHLPVTFSIPGREENRPTENPPLSLEDIEAKLKTLEGN